jgi:hypothetical protein
VESHSNLVLEVRMHIQAASPYALVNSIVDSSLKKFPTNVCTFRRPFAFPNYAHVFSVLNNLLVPLRRVFLTRGSWRKLVHQINVAVGAVREPRTILNAALRAKHGRKLSTKGRAVSYLVLFELFVTSVTCFSISA